MKKYIYMAAFLAIGQQAEAQNTYDNAILATEDLNGTARYVAMGGAMDALGTDISTISSNPAGLGLIRRSTANFTVGVVGQQDAQNWGGGHATHMVFDQAGFVWANQISSTDFVNFAFNYHMSRNFNHILKAADNLPLDENGYPCASQNRLTYEKEVDGLLYDANNNALYTNTQLDYALMENTDLVWDTQSQSLGYWGATDYTMNRATKGYISCYDFALSGNVDNTFYWGITLGLQDVKYRHYGEYLENYRTEGNYNLRVQDDRAIDGTGFDLKLGVIFRPIDDSPLRFGVSVATPTWYDLKSQNVSYLISSNSGERVPFENLTHDFKLNTPWKFGLSAGHAIGREIAVGVGYEYADYSAMDTRYDNDDYYYSSSTSDEIMNRHTEETLRGVSTFKVGVEYCPIPELAFRVGYNYVSPMYQKVGYKDTTVDSPGTSVLTTTDFTNWDSTNRFSLGIGYNIGNWNVAATYLYTEQKGTFEPFYYESPYEDFCVDANQVNIVNKRNHFQLSVGYKF